MDDLPATMLSDLGERSDRIAGGGRSWEIDIDHATTGGAVSDDIRIHRRHVCKPETWALTSENPL